jgi:YggT family protein
MSIAGFLFQFLNLLITVLTVAILIRALLTWIPNLDPSNPLVRLLNQVTDPVLQPARRLIPPVGGMDLSPIVVILVLQGLQMLLQRL